MKVKVEKVTFPDGRVVELPYATTWDDELQDDYALFDMTIQLISKLKEELDCVKFKINN